MKKKFLVAFIITCTFIMSMGIINASAGTYGDLTYKVSNGEVTITNCNTSATSVIIPSTIEGYPVTSIGFSAFYDCSSLASVTIPDSVKIIEYFAFYGCEGLESITIPDGVTSIGNCAFYGCSGLNNIMIGNSVAFIGSAVFENCGSITSVTIPKSVTTIVPDAFSCNIKTVYYTGTEEEWNKINTLSSTTWSGVEEVIFNYVIPSVETQIIRATSTNTSLKFISKAIIEGEPEIATFGTTFIPLWLFEENSTDTATVEYNNEDYDIQNGQTFGATLTGIPESFKDIEIVGKSYIKTAEGNYKWSVAKYATVNNTTLRIIE